MKACPERGKMVFSVTFMQSPQIHTFGVNTDKGGRKL